MAKPQSPARKDRGFAFPALKLGFLCDKLRAENWNLRISIGRTDENLKMTEDIMKKTAVLIYNSFCNFEFSVALEILALAEKEVVIFAHTKEAVKSEDGLMVLPNQTISEINIDEYDSLILPGAMDIREAIENEEVIEFIRKFENKAIGAISIAPLMLVKAGLLSGKPFMAGVNKEEIMEEGFTEQDLEKMVGWDANLESPVKEGYIITDNIITSISYNFVKWGLAFGRMIGIDIPPETFGI